MELFFARCDEMQFELRNVAETVDAKEAHYVLTGRGIRAGLNADFAAASEKA